MTDLFSFQSGPEQIRLPGADVMYWPNLGLASDPEHYLHRLLSETPWRQESVRVWGKVHQQPRLIAWYGDPQSNYSYSGIKLSPLSWSELILEIRSVVEDMAGEVFNSVLLNYYRDGNDSMGFHSDDEKELGARPTIASVSLGAERALAFKSKVDESAKIAKVPLASGSLLLMKGETQRLYKHGIAKERGNIGPRVNLTFRRIGLS
ncbi:alpha-ketoglutarate-dependent dioxygenase AlkB family protein [Sphingomonas bisphenolicum]|uniref:Alpha-ketoglutarate-dependent dioxygenase AlkB n=1 Tax=Sphingomonas bisphenolicum TaxID=296544 RepID=A0ABM7G808_9SPHN|nr:alpha-ketoglutarate-dependent dioxygenase AlkB [Sphingomonas bisphenolicum]BBF71059.1 alpha-ketoglutarate-dependent dioxygenase AlkB [Sphingomonas bisphenolicum]